MTICILSEGLLPSIVTILRVTVMKSNCAFATLFSQIIVQMHEAWVPINGITFFPDFLKFDHMMLKLGTRTDRRPRTHTHTHTHTHLDYLIGLLFFQEEKFVEKCISPGNSVLNQYGFQLWLSCYCNGSAFLLFHFCTNYRHTN